MFPETIADDIDLKQHFFHNRPWFFALGAALPLLDAVDTALKGWRHFTDQGMIYPVTIGLLFGLNVIGALTTRERYHKFYACFLFVYLLIFISVNLRLLA